MFEFIIKIIVDSMPYIASMGIFVYVVVFIIAGLEASPIGAVFPGVIIMLYFGSMVSQHFIRFLPCLIAAILGAVIGDVVSYYIGRYGRRFFKEDHKYLSTKNLALGRSFFDKYGGKSIIFARFIGPIRPAVPIIAGTTHMDIMEFTLWNIIGATIWSATYLMLGVFVGKKWYVFGKYFSQIGLILSILGLVIFLIWLRMERKKVVGV
jgi:membrane protein DedA with SNARE-associated domain